MFEIIVHIILTLTKLFQFSDDYLYLIWIQSGKIVVIHCHMIIKEESADRNNSECG